MRRRFGLRPTWARTWIWALAATLAGSAGAAEPQGAASPAGAAEFSWQASRDGIVVEAAIEPVEAPARGGAEAPPLQEGDAVRVRFRVSDTLTGQPLPALYPAAWMDRLPRGAEDGAEECKRKVQSFLGGTLLAEAEVDLNVYYVLALNDDATISVVDPIFGFGGSKLLEMVFLESPGEDWALSADGRRLYVSMPAVGKVAAVDTATWRVVRAIEVAPRPVEVTLPGDGRFLWVGLEGEEPGVVAVDTQTLEVAARVATGRGPHHLAASDDGGWLFVTEGLDRAVTVVDLRSMTAARRVELGGRPVSVAWSRAAGAAYLSLVEGSVVAVAPEAGRPPVTIEAEPGLGHIAFAPGGRFAFVVNPEEDLLHVIDAAGNRLVQTADVLDAPVRVAFSDELAYVRHAGSEIVLMIPLSAVGEPGAPVPVIEFPGGQRPPRDGGAPSPASPIVQAPGAYAVLVANPADRHIYYYKEGMAAPMGSFKNYGRRPRAVAVVDRSLRESAPGVYETAVELRRPGAYDLALYLDSPPTVHCFPFRVAPNPEIERAALENRLAVEWLEQPVLVPGEEAELRFRVRDALSGEPVPGLDDLTVLTFLVPGTWQSRWPAEPLGEGAYRVAFTPPEEGLYAVYFASLDYGMGFNRSPSYRFEAIAARPSPARSGEAGVSGSR
jgi:DNA-binding beta-propeller fold protein YncE